jgi:hypothetical protein
MSTKVSDPDIKYSFLVIMFPKNRHSVLCVSLLFLIDKTCLQVLYPNAYICA